MRQGRGPSASAPPGFRRAGVRFLVSTLPRWRFPTGRYGEPALTSAGAADECTHQSRPELDCRVSKLTFSNSRQRITRSQRQRHPLHEVAWARQKTPAKTRVANAAGGVEVRNRARKYGRKALFAQFLADCEADWPTAWPVELRVQLCNRFATRTRWARTMASSRPWYGMVWCPSCPLDFNRCDQVVAAGSGAG
jgi:hypothetical protein